MENSPFTHLPNTEGGPTPPESEKKDKKDSKKSKAIGILAFEQPAPAAEKPDDKLSLSKLFEAPARDKKPAEASDELSIDKAADKQELETAVDDKPELSPEDTEYALHEIAAERQAEVAEEPVADDPEEQAAHAAAEEFYNRIVDEGLPFEAAMAETEADDMPAEDAPEPEVVPSPSERDETEPKDEDASTPITPQTSAPAAAGGGGGAVPPRPPRPPSGPAPFGPVPPPSPAVVPPAIYAGVAATPNAPQVVTRTEYVPYYDRSRAFGDALVGGIVGYLIGRRRGRIKTERKLLPVQHKLEREVKSLSERLASAEFTIRETAKQKVREQQAPVQTPETVVSLHDQKAAPEVFILGRRERPLPAPELHTKPSFTPPSERIGKVLIAAEAVRAPITETPRAEKRNAEVEKADTRSAQQQVETLSRNELMTLSEKVIVEGSTLRQVYETNLISERGLRRLITEYLRGGDVVKAFRRELVEREIDFERDPKLRDTVRKNLSGGGASPTLNKLLQQAGISSNEDSPHELSQARAQQLRDAKQQSKRASQRKYVDISLITIIAVLMAIILVLVANRM